MKNFAAHALSSWSTLSQTNASANATVAHGMTMNVPNYMLEGFLPGFGILSRILLTVLGIDISSIVSMCFVGAGLLTALNYGFRSISSLFTDWISSRITVKSDDKLYEQIMDWVSKQKLTRDSRHLLAQSTLKSDSHDAYRSRRGRGKIDYGEIESMTPPAYTPAHGIHRFWYKGRYFALNRDENRDGIGGALRSLAVGSRAGEEETITLTCLGLSPAPLKQLIMDIKAFAAAGNKSMTTVRRPGHPYQESWFTALVRPSRPMDTVYMDDDVKSTILEDMREFLEPTAPRFYARRGIPYRRGYLFHGPPGTGKTSLSFALAGEFGIDVHVAGLRDPSMTEQRLTDLMSSLPSRCIVLLEDIDSAGIKREEDVKTAKKEEEDQTTMRRMRREMGVKEEGITLSGLLNAIDGVASQEGRLLIMTTNHPEKLDPALIRPGRVDHQVYFGNANHSHMRQIFVRMFTRDPLPDGEQPDAQHQAAVLADVDPAQLEDMAARFAKALDEEVFTPAEIQGFLLVHRKSPQKALDNVAAWREELVAAKEAGRNVIAERERLAATKMVLDEVEGRNGAGGDAKDVAPFVNSGNVTPIVNGEGVAGVATGIDEHTPLQSPVAPIKDTDGAVPPVKEEEPTREGPRLRGGRGNHLGRQGGV